MKIRRNKNIISYEIMKFPNTLDLTAMYFKPNEECIYALNSKQKEIVFLIVDFPIKKIELYKSDELVYTLDEASKIYPIEKEWTKILVYIKE